MTSKDDEECNDNIESTDEDEDEYESDFDYDDDASLSEFQSRTLEEKGLTSTLRITSGLTDQQGQTNCKEHLKINNDKKVPNHLQWAKEVDEKVKGSYLSNTETKSYPGYEGRKSIILRENLGEPCIMESSEIVQDKFIENKGNETNVNLENDNSRKCEYEENRDNAGDHLSKKKFSYISIDDSNLERIISKQQNYSSKIFNENDYEKVKVEIDAERSTTSISNSQKCEDKKKFDPFSLESTQASEVVKTVTFNIPSEEIDCSIMETVNNLKLPLFSEVDNEESSGANKTATKEKQFWEDITRDSNNLVVLEKIHLLKQNEDDTFLANCNNFNVAIENISEKSDIDYFCHDDAFGCENVNSSKISEDNQASKSIVIYERQTLHETEEHDATINLHNEIMTTKSKHLDVLDNNTMFVRKTNITEDAGFKEAEPNILEEKSTRFSGCKVFDSTKNDINDFLVSFEESKDLKRREKQLLDHEVLTSKFKDILSSHKEIGNITQESLIDEKEDLFQFSNVKQPNYDYSYSKIIPDDNDKILSSDIAQKYGITEKGFIYIGPILRSDDKMNGSNEPLGGKDTSNDTFLMKSNIQIMHEPNNEFKFKTLQNKKKKKKRKRKRKSNAEFLHRMVNYQAERDKKIKKAQLELMYEIEPGKKKCPKCGKVQCFEEVFNNLNLCSSCGSIPYVKGIQFDVQKFNDRQRQCLANRAETIKKILAEEQNVINEAKMLNKKLGGAKQKINPNNVIRVLSKKEEALLIQRISKRSKSVKPKDSDDFKIGKTKYISEERRSSFINRMSESEDKKQSSLQRAREESIYNGRVDKRKCLNCGKEQSFDEYQNDKVNCDNESCQKLGMRYETRKFDMKLLEKRINEFQVKRSKAIEKMESELASQRLSKEAKSRKQIELANKITDQTGKNFLERMNDDLKERETKKNNLNCLQDELLNISCPFKPKLNISKKHLKKRQLKQQK